MISLIVDAMQKLNQCASFSLLLTHSGRFRIRIVLRVKSGSYRVSSLCAYFPWFHIEIERICEHIFLSKIFSQLSIKEKKIINLCEYNKQSPQIYHIKIIEKIVTQRL